MSETIDLPSIDVTAERVPEQFGPPASLAPPAAPPTPPKPAGPKRPSDELTLVLAGQKLQGWQDVRVTRGIELMPSSFELRITERFPDAASSVSVDPGQTCKVMIGDDLVLTGYADTYGSAVDARQHEVKVSGRSATEDLVDCQAGMSPGQEGKTNLTIRASTFLQLATDLCAPLGITVSQPDGPGEPLVSFGDGELPQISVSLGQTVYDVLEPFARWQRQLMIDGVDGNLVLAKVGTKKAASGFSLPGNVQSARVGFSKQDRYTIYIPARFSFDQFYDVAAAGGEPSANYFQMVPDEAAFQGQSRHDGKPRYRPLAVVSEQSLVDVDLAEERAKWEKARRFGRSQAVTVEVPSWRDSAGTLWTPNTLTTVDIPALKLTKLTWIIAEVTYLRGFKGGTRALVTLMPPEAFQPAPDLFTPFDPQIAQALRDEYNQRRAGGAGPSSTGQG